MVIFIDNKLNPKAAVMPIPGRKDLFIVTLTLAVLHFVSYLNLKVLAR